MESPGTKKVVKMKLIHTEYKIYSKKKGKIKVVKFKSFIVSVHYKLSNTKGNFILKSELLEFL